MAADYAIKNASGEYWSGHSWTNAPQFAKLYEFEFALELVEKRFHRMPQRPRLVALSELKKQPKRYQSPFKNV